MLSIASPAWLAWLFDGVGQGRCPVCAAVGPGAGACARCLEGLAQRVAGFCPACGELAPDESGPLRLCQDCGVQPPPWDGLGFYGRYGQVLRECVLGLKFGGRLALAPVLAERLAAAYEAGLGRVYGFDPAGPEVVAAVPLHWTRLVRRGYNQSAELARGFARRIGAPFASRALAKTRRTAPQARLDASRRQTNLRGAFAARPLAVQGRRVLLVDDVMTTGATLAQAAQALRACGASRVEVLVLARD